VAAGAAFGAAGSVKWSGFYALAAAMALVAVWTVAGAIRIRRSQEPGTPRRAPGALTELNFSLTAMALPALAVYLLSYASFFVERSSVIGLSAHKRFSVGAFFNLQGQMLSYHLHLKTAHTYASPAWKWPILYRPVAYYFTGGVKDRHILAFGNPAIWWLALAAGAWFLYKALVRRDVIALSVMALWLAQYLPWALFSRPQFFFYMAPIVPFMMLAVTGVILEIVRGYRSENVLMGSIAVLAVLCLLGGLLWFHGFNFGPSLDQQRRIVEVAGIPILALGLAAVLGVAPRAAPLRKVLAGAYLGIACVLALVYFYPVIAAWAIPAAQWQHRMLFPTWI
jgi:dolichyl-phosphate-mannose--protein O-mannosyl transferase